MTECPSIFLSPRLRLLWILFWCLTLLLAAFFHRGTLIDTDIRAMLPQSDVTREQNAVLSRIADNNARDIIVLVGGKPSEAKAAARAFLASVPQDLVPKQKGSLSLAELRAFFLPYREYFLSPQDAAAADTLSDKAILDRSLKNLYRPVSNSLFSWSDDPLALFTSALMQNNEASRFSQDEELLWLADPDTPGRRLYYLPMKAPEALSISGTKLTQTLAQAKEKVLAAHPDVSVLIAGIPLISEGAADRAAHESTLIGAVGALGIIALTGAFFGEFTPVVLALLTLGASFAFAFAATLLLFGSVHLLTLVFGATLLGVCVDYVFHFLCATHSNLTPQQAVQKLSRPLTISLLSSLIGYALMAVSPVAGLQQMAFFCLAGLVCTFLTVLLLFPEVTRRRPPTRLFLSFAQILMRAPKIQKPGAVAVFCGAVALFALGFGLQLKPANELALLSAAPAELLSAQREAGKLLSGTSPGQFFFVNGQNAEDLLSRCEELVGSLNGLERQGTITGFSAPCGILPSEKRQRANAAVAHRLNARARELVQRTLGEVPAFAPTAANPLSLEAFLDSPLGSAMSAFLVPQKEGPGALVLLKGVTAESLSALSKLDRPGIRFFNSTGDVAVALSLFRSRVTFLVLLAGFVCLVLLRKNARYTFLPALLSILITVGVMGAVGIPYSLYTVLPLILLLGLGVDYAVLLHDSSGKPAAWNSVFLAGSSTLLSFGLLACSSTEALHLFGITIAVGIATVWILTPLLRK